MCVSMTVCQRVHPPWYKLINASAVLHVAIYIYIYNVYITYIMHVLAMYLLVMYTVIGLITPLKKAAISLSSSLLCTTHKSVENEFYRHVATYSNARI